MNQQDQDTQLKALRIVQAHFSSGIPESAQSAHEALTSNQCWACVRPYFEKLLQACEAADQTWTPAKTRQVKDVLGLP